MRWAGRPGRDERRRRADFERAAQGLVGCTVQEVHYWDVHQLGAQPDPWDFGDWHLAVLGVELGTDRGPVTITWTNRFYSYGVEVFHEPMESHPFLGPDGPERVGPDEPGPWAPFLGRPVQRVVVSWEPADDERASTERPSAARLDLDAGQVWFVAAYPPDAAGETTAVAGGDEIMVVFTRQVMDELGLGHLASGDDSRSGGVADRTR